MTDLHKFKLVLPLNPVEASIEMDGKPLLGVTMVSVGVTTKSGPTEVQLSIIGYVLIEGELRHEALVVANWEDRDWPPGKLRREAKAAEEAAAKAREEEDGDAS